MTEPTLRMSATLVDDLADFIEDLSCTFWACDGHPTTRPVDMKTCSRCIILARLLEAKMIAQGVGA